MVKEQLSPSPKHEHLGQRENIDGVEENPFPSALK